jgi:hypothetical protein
MSETEFDAAYGDLQRLTGMPHLGTPGSCIRSPSRNACRPCYTSPGRRWLDKGERCAENDLNRGKRFSKRLLLDSRHLLETGFPRRIDVMGFIDVSGTGAALVVRHAAENLLPEDPGPGCGGGVPGEESHQTGATPG